MNATAICLSLDIGTTNVKAALVTEQGRVLATAGHEYPMKVPRPGWAEQDPEVWWDTTCDVIRACVRALPPGGEVRVVSLSGQMHGMVPLDKKGTPLRNAVIWADRRSAAECAEILSIISYSQFVRLTGNRPFPGSTLASLLWFKRNEQELYRECHTVLCPKDYIRYRLTGVLGTDPVDASGMLMFDVVERQWADGLLVSLGLSPALLPQLHRSDELVGPLLDSVAEQLGLPRVPVVAGAGDQGTGALGNGLIKGSVAAITVGTGGQVLAGVSKPLIDPDGRVQTLCHASDGMWLLMAATLSAGLSLRWLRDVLQSQEGGSTPGDTSDFYSRLDQKVEELPGDTPELYFLPYLAGERCPHFDPAARGVFVGLELGMRAEHLAKAVMEGVAYSLRQCLDLIGACGCSVDRVRLAGGGARSAVWARIFANILGLPVERMPAVDSTLIGAALLGFVASGRYRHIEEAVDVAIGPSTTIDPEPHERVVHQHRYDRFTQLYRLLHPHFHPKE